MTPNVTNKSEGVALQAGQFVPIEVRYMHSVHNSLFEDGTAFCHLFWESDQINKQIVPQHYLFDIVESGVLKITD